jgi:hypothetical protein
MVVESHCLCRGARGPVRFNRLGWSRELIALNQLAWFSELGSLSQPAWLMTANLVPTIVAR